MIPEPTGSLPEAQPQPLKVTLTYADNRVEELQLAPLGLEIREVALP